MYKIFIRPLLFILRPEKAHLVTVLIVRSFKYIPGLKWLIRRIFQYESNQFNLIVTYLMLKDIFVY